MSRISIPKIHIRKIIHNSHCEYLGEFDCVDILYFFGIYSKLWLKEHTNCEGIIENDDIGNLIESSDEFNILENDYFIVGYPITHMYEGITTKCTSMFISTPDKYGFETLKDNNGTILEYKYANQNKI